MPFKNGNPPLYQAWRDMIWRCYGNSKWPQFKDYGGRGIKVCPQWRHDYKRFYADMAPKPEGTVLDRIDNDGDYTPENCRWLTRRESQRNQRVTRKVLIEGIAYVAADLADLAGVKTDTIVERANRGLSYKDVIAKERTFNLEGFKLGAAASAKKRSARTHCKNGHKYTNENTSIHTDGKHEWRHCLDCYRLKHPKK